MFSYFSEYYFTNFIAIVASAYLLLIGVKNFSRLGNLKPFVFYTAISILQSLTVIIITIYNPFDFYNTRFIEVSIHLFLLIEFTIFYIYLNSAIISKPMKILMKVFFILFVSALLIFWTANLGFKELPDILTVIEAVLILIPCLFYYYELFIYPPIKNIRLESRFWVITGMFFLFSSFIPLFLFRNNLFHFFPSMYTSVYSVNYIAYTILFACFLNGMLCTIKVTR